MGTNELKIKAPVCVLVSKLHLPVMIKLKLFDNKKIDKSLKILVY